MKAYKNDSPEYSDSIQIYEVTDPVDAETVDNVPLKQLFDNSAYVKNKQDAQGLTVENGLLCVTVTDE